jgi:hypothetical protein
LLIVTLIGAVPAVRLRLVRTVVRERGVDAFAFGLRAEPVLPLGRAFEFVLAETGTVLDGLERTARPDRDVEPFAFVLGAVDVAFDLECDPCCAAMAAVGTASTATSPRAINFLSIPAPFSRRCRPQGSASIRPVPR